MLVRFFVFFLFVFTGSISFVSSSPNLNHCIFSGEQPSHALLQLLDFLDLQHDGTLQGIVDVTQKKWLRAQNKERWEIDEQSSANLSQEIYLLLDELGMFRECVPSNLNYDCAVVFGATLPTFRQRLAYLVKQWKEGVRFKSIVFLCGLRPLQHSKETSFDLLDENNGVLPFRSDWAKPKNLPQNEAEMAKFVFDQAELPDQLRRLPVDYIATLDQPNADGTFRRANTKDTLVQWIATDPFCSSILFVSNQPFIGYQAAIVQNLLPQTYVYETIGAGSPYPSSIAVCLDTLARWLYVYNQK